MHDLLRTSALIQLTFAVWLGWVVLAFTEGRTTVGPFKVRRPTLQCHIDNLMMGTLQLAIAGTVDDLPTFAGALLVFGSWINPQLFLAMAIGFSAYEGEERHDGVAALSERVPRSALRELTRVVRFSSFLSLSVAYPWLAIANF